MADKIDRPSDSSILYPFMRNGFSRGVCLALVPAIVSCVIARSPQFSLSELPGLKLPIPFDAIMLILSAPLYFVVVTWLLKRVAERGGAHSERWEPRDVKVMAGLTALLGASALFLLGQFFVILAPAGTCPGPRYDLLWRYIPGPVKVEHCMSTAKAINEKAWFYMEPTLLQAWLNVALVALSLWLLWSAWRAWRSKLPTQTPSDGMAQSG